MQVDLPLENNTEWRKKKMKAPKQRNTEARIYAKLVEIRDILHEYNPDCTYLTLSIVNNHIAFNNAYFDDILSDAALSINFTEPREEE